MALFNYQEKEIVRALYEGKNVEKATRRLYEKYWEPLTVFLIRTMHVEQFQAEDHIQDAILLLVRQIRKGGFSMDGSASLKTYLYRIAINCVLKENKLKERRINAESAFAEIAGEYQEFSPEEEQEILKLEEDAAWEKFSKLGELCRNLLMMVANGLKVKEIQVALGIDTEVNVRVRKTRCLKKLLIC